MNTPMQLLKNQFDTFKELLPKEFKETALNKSEDDVYVNRFCGDRTVFEKKGVKSDFIKFFKAKFNDKDSFSIGFSFNYLDLNESEFSVKVSLKVGNKEPSYLKSESLGIEEFRQKMNKFNESLVNVEGNDAKKVVDNFKSSFSLKQGFQRKSKSKNKL